MQSSSLSQNLIQSQTSHDVTSNTQTELHNSATHNSATTPLARLCFLMHTDAIKLPCCRAKLTRGKAKYASSNCQVPPISIIDYQPGKPHSMMVAGRVR